MWAMLLKLAWRNIRHSVRDYTIYFLTLLFGVAVFYAFNSIGGQEVMFDLQSEADERQFQMTEQFLSMFSGLIACVLGFSIRTDSLSADASASSAPTCCWAWRLPGSRPSC